VKFLKQLALIFAVCLAGEGLAGLLPFTFPGSVLSMVLLFVLLASKLLKLEQVEDAGDFFLKNMAFLFVPTVVGVMEHFPLLLQNLLPLLAVIIITTILTFGAAAWTATAVIRLQSRKKGGKADD
jgi:holin-like protein